MWAWFKAGGSWVWIAWIKDVNDISAHELRKLKRKIKYQYVDDGIFSR